VSSYTPRQDRSGAYTSNLPASILPHSSSNPGFAGMIVISVLPHAEISKGRSPCTAHHHHCHSLHDELIELRPNAIHVGRSIGAVAIFILLL
jgi:hypothetical protein